MPYHHGRPWVGRWSGKRWHASAGEAHGVRRREAPHRAVARDVEIVERLVDVVRRGDDAVDDVEDEARRALARRGGASEEIEVVRRDVPLAARNT